MRGIGAGQRILVFIVPEVRRCARRLSTFRSGRGCGLRLARGVRTLVMGQGARHSAFCAEDCLHMSESVSRRGTGATCLCVLSLIIDCCQVAELIQRELRHCQPQIQAPDAGAMDHAAALATAGEGAKAGLAAKQWLVDIVAWLVINSMRSERVQWTMLCVQNIANV